jgi:serine/threonine protein kinase
MTGRVGSWTYMAPEVVLNQPYNQSVDTFSFGVVLYEVLAHTVLLGVSPQGLSGAQQEQRFAAGKLAAQMWACQVASGARPRLPGLWPKPLVQLVEACWHQVRA